jgi:heterodisulfide reductase subunit C
MSWLFPGTESQAEFLRQVEEISAQRVADCYQCGKCTAGCPTAFAMDYPPNQIMRGVQLGMRDAVLSSKAIWLCASCETCTTRCPQEVDVAGVIDALRNIAFSQGIKSPEQDVPLFHRIFLGSVRQFGRLFEAGMIVIYNLFSGHYVKDVLMAPKLLLKGKLALLPSRAGGRGVKELFARVQELESKQG